MSNEDFQKLIREYSLDYCHFLEAVYGKGMMSEGGSQAIDAMFYNIPLAHKTALDLGSGLGGVALYLAKNYNLSVIGIDINPDIIIDANKRIPEELTKQLSFQTYDDLSQLPFPDKHFDIVYSKGVLTHIKEKQPLFDEIARILKPNGKFIINDWLSPINAQWSASILKMCEIENLTLYAVSPESYRQYLTQAGFKIIDERDDTAVYSSYNQHQVDWLHNPQHSASFKTKFGEHAWQEACEGYQLIADAMKAHELLVKNFVCIKS